MYDLNAAIIGAGFMGPTHTEALRRIGVQVHGILGIDDAESKKAAKTLDIPKAYRNWQEALDDPDVQVIHITTPNKLHYQMAKEGLQAGKHILCEKPLAMNARESGELVELAQKSGLVTGLNYNMRFYPLVMEAKDKVSSGQTGEIHAIVGSYVQDWLLFPTDYNWRVLAQEGGATRAISDIGTHWLDMVQYVTGCRVTAVCADLKIVHPVRKRPKGEVETFSGKVQEVQATENVDITTEDCGTVLLRFDNGARGNLWVSQVTAGRKNCLRFEISGSKQAISWNSETPNEIWIGSRTGPNDLLLKDPGLLSESGRSATSYPGGHNEGYPDSFKQCFKAFYDYITAGDFKAPKPFASFGDGHHEILLCDAIHQSHTQGRWVEVEPS